MPPLPRGRPTGAVPRKAARGARLPPGGIERGARLGLGERQPGAARNLYGRETKGLGLEAHRHVNSVFHDIPPIPLQRAIGRPRWSGTYGLLGRWGFGDLYNLSTDDALACALGDVDPCHCIGV